MAGIDYDKVVHKLYSGVLCEGGWQSALADMRSLMNSEQATFLVHDYASGATAISEIASIDLPFMQAYESEFFSMDPVRPVVAAMPLGDWFIDEHMLGRHTITHGDFYQAFLRQFGIQGIMCCPLIHDQKNLAGLAFQSGIGRSSFDSSDVKLMSPLIPHLLQASRLRVEFKRLSNLAQLGQRLLNSIPTPILLVNASAKVLFANEAGERWLSDSSAQTFGRNRAIQLEKARIAISVLARDLCREDAVSHVGSKIPLDTGGDDAYYFLGFSLPEGHPISEGFTERVGLIVVRGIFSANESATIMFQQLFGLSAAESRLMEELQRSNTLRDCASSLGIVHETARSQLKSIFLKTDCHSQAALLRLWTELTRDHIK